MARMQQFRCESCSDVLVPRNTEVRHTVKCGSCGSEAVYDPLDYREMNSITDEQMAAYRRIEIEAEDYVHDLEHPTRVPVISSETPWLDQARRAQVSEASTEPDENGCVIGFFLGIVLLTIFGVCMAFCARSDPRKTVDPGKPIDYREEVRQTKIIRARERNGRPKPSVDEIFASEKGTQFHVVYVGYYRVHFYIYYENGSILRQELLWKDWWAQMTDQKLRLRGPTKIKKKEDNQ